MAQKIKVIYENEVVPYLKETFEYKNIHEIPKIEKNPNQSRFGC